MSPHKKATGGTTLGNVTWLIGQTFLLGLITLNNIPGSTAVVTEVDVTCPLATGQTCPWGYVQFWLYTRRHPYGVLLQVHSLDAAPWTSGHIKVLIHGYTGSKDTSLNANVRPAYLAVDDYNIISVDWSPLSRKGCYLETILNVRLVGQCVSDLIKAAAAVNRLSNCDVHLLGYSLGAQVAAWASIRLPYLKRLTELDPAYPLVNSRNSVPGRAQFVDVYHTNAGILGQSAPSGQMDVYFNNYVHQPGCGCNVGCSHERILAYYAESILSRRPIKAFPCASWLSYCNGGCPAPRPYQFVDVGEYANPTLRGSYTVFTRGVPPYLLGTEVYSPAVFFTFSILLDEKTECPCAPILDNLVPNLL